MSDYLGKPFTSQELWQCLLKYFKPVSVSIINEQEQAVDDTKLQKQLKINFVKSNQTIYADICEAIAADDIKLAHRLAHSLKSNAGQIGEKRLQEAAAAVEGALKTGKDSLTEEQKTVLEAELKTVLEKLAPLLTEIKPQQAEAIDADALTKLLEKLKPMLINRNPECMNMLDEIRAILGAGELVQHIEDFEFKKALAAIEIIEKELL
jgi:HPt (histidine-containing phosphotransfer) domain-containing protein